MFGGGVGAQERRRQASGDGRHVDNAPGRAGSRAVGAQQRRKGLDDRDLRNKIDFDLAPELFDRLMQQWAGRGDPCVVDEACERGRAEPLADVLRRFCDALRVGYVKHERGQFVADLFGKPVRVVHTAHAGENMKPLARQQLRGGVADAGRGPGDDDGSFHVPLSCCRRS